MGQAPNGAENVVTLSDPLQAGIQTPQSKGKERRATGSSPHQHGMANNAMETLSGTMERHLDRYANSTAVEGEAIANLTTANATLVATNAELATKMEYVEVPSTLKCRVTSSTSSLFVWSWLGFNFG